MHELALTQSILARVLQTARAHGAGRVLKIELALGEFSDVVPRYVESLFPTLSAGTEAENAALHFTRVPGRVRCLRCGQEAEVARGGEYRCPACQSAELRLVSGREFTLQSIEVDAPAAPDAKTD